MMSDLAGIRLLLIDNYSSFTQNLVHYLAQVTGERPVVVSNDADEPPLHEFDAIVLSPGPGSPVNSEDFGISSKALAQDAVPVLGICLGHQGLGTLSGAVLSAADEPWHGRVSTIVHEGDVLFEGIPEQFGATRYHSLILRDPVPPDLQCIARTASGEIMALRHRVRPYWSVQFHPESIATEHGHRLLENFCRLARSRTRVRGGQTTTVNEVTRDPAKVQKWTLRYRHIENAPEPAEVFDSLYGDSETAFWLDGSASQSISYLGDATGPYGYRLSYDVTTRKLTYSVGRSGQEQCPSVFAHIDAVLASNQVDDEALDFDFKGGLVGYFGYELKGELGAINVHRSPWPDAQWLWVDRFVAYDHARQRTTLVALVPAACDEGASIKWLDAMAEALCATPPTRRSWEPGSLHWRENSGAYKVLVERCLAKIREGQSYELCLTTQLCVRVEAHGLELFRRMRETNPAPYAAFLRCDGFELASASPERFLRIDSTGGVESKPIKGTARRDADPKVDRQLAQKLATSEKERAENLMIVDLVRHDLAHTCEVGSVVVSAFAEVESYSSVHQLVSTVQGQLRPDATALQCVAAAFPGGSMTGAPKKRAMEILEQVETGPRGPYAGSLGYLSMTGAANLSIVIRSALVEPGQVYLGVGGAITALSDPQSELEEMQLKSRAQVEALLR